MKKLVAFLGFLVTTMGILFMYFSTICQGHQILRYLIYFILIAIWVYNLSVVLSEPNKRRRRRRR